MNLGRKKHEHEREHEHEHDQGAVNENLHAELSEHVSVSEGACSRDQVTAKVDNLQVYTNGDANWLNDEW